MRERPCAVAPSSSAPRRPGDRGAGRAWAPVAAIAAFLLAGCTGGDGDAGTTTSESQGSPGAAPKAPLPEDPLERADALIARGREAKASRDLRARLETVPPSERGPWLERVAYAAWRLGAWSRALDMAREARDAGRESPRVQLVLGDTLREVARAGEARTVLEELVEEHPGFAPGRVALGRVLFRLGESGRALELFRTGLPELGEVPTADTEEAELEFARALRSAGELEEAADRLALLLERRPAEAVLYSELAATLYRRGLRSQGRFLESIYRRRSQRAFDEEVEGKLRASGREALAKSQEALNLERHQRYLDAWRAHRAALAIDRSDARVTVFFAELGRRLARWEDALEAIDAALEAGAAPASGLHLARGLTALDAGDPASAREAFRAARRALRKEGDLGGPEHGQAGPAPVAFGLARTAIETGDPAAAEAEVRPWLERRPERWEPPYWIARARAARGEWRAALGFFKKAAERGGASAREVRLWTGRALLEAGAPEQAKGLLAACLRDGPVEAEVVADLVRCLEDDPERQAEAARRRKLAVEKEAELDAALAALQDEPLDECAALYAKAGRAAIGLRRPEARDWLLLAAELDPRDLDVLRLLVERIRRNEDIFFRLRFQRRVLDVDPDDLAALQDFAQVYAKLRVRLDEALRFAERRHDTAPDAVSYRVLGEVRRARGELDEAVRLLREGAAAHPDDERLAKALEAAREARRAREGRPDE